MAFPEFKAKGKVKFVTVRVDLNGSPAHTQNSLSLSLTHTHTVTLFLSLWDSSLHFHCSQTNKTSSHQHQLHHHPPLPPSQLKAKLSNQKIIGIEKRQWKLLIHYFCFTLLIFFSFTDCPKIVASFQLWKFLLNFPFFG